MKKVILLGIISELLLLVLSQHANPLKDPLICGIPTCSITGHKFKYTPQNYFIYKYSIEATSIFNGTSKNESTLFIDADVTLNFLTPCDGLLAISDIILSETAPGDNEKIPTSTNSQLFSDMMREHTLRFAFKDGIIYEICPDDDEENWPINFKRGILSMIHNSMKRFDLDYSGEEEDVRGICSTDYKVIGAKETSLLIEKTKNLETCRERIKVNSIVQFTPVSNFHSRTRNEDILKSSSRCVMSIDENIYSDIACEENYVLEPFSNNAAGASTRVIQKLTLKERGEKKLSEENKIWRRTNLKFDHSIPKQPTIGDLRITRDLIKKLCKESQHDSQSDFSDFFGKFIYGLRSLSYPALTSLYAHSGATCPSAKEHVLEALPYINTAGSLGLMKDIILANTLSEDTLDNWMMSIAFISNPDIDMIEAAYTILKENPYSSKTNIFLSIASLTHTFCSQNSHCEKRASIYSIIQHFEHNFLELLEDDTANREVQDQVIVTLKALSSIGVISENFAAELFKVVNYSNLDVGIRVAALETFRRLPCEKHRSYFESIFEDQEQDSEVRISAYLQVMRCPSYLLIRTIAYNLRNEEVNQVGSFVWSHLHNIIKSANPLKVEIQSLLSEEDLIEKFSGDIRKFSHNREFSLYFDEYNFGGNYESNVLFSPSSYIPRSAMVNLTVDLFGKYVNLLEVQGRVEGFEHYLESFFGPGGRANVIKEKMEEYKMRWIREASEKNLVENNVQDIADAVDNLEKNPKVALGIKIFGNDLKYATFKGDGEIKQAMEYFNILTYLKQILSGKEIMYKKATMFLDSNYVVPSGAGLPLFISALGTASVNIKLFGSLKAAGFSQKKELDLVANFEPTAAIDISAEMSLSAFYESTGIKLKTDMQSSIAVKGNIEIKGAKLVSVKFSLPKKNVKIFGARSELLVRQKNIENPQTGLQKTSVSNSMCSWPAISEAIGLTLCTDYSYRNSTSIFNAPDFILAGPANFQIYVQKSDPTANIYLFEYKWKQAHDLDVISLTFDTPGSEVNRLMHSNFTMSKDGHNLTMLMQSSSGIILARGVIKNTEEQKVFQMVLDINDKKHFDTSVGYDRFKKVNGYIYKPKLYIGVNGERVVELKGTVDLISKKDISQYTLDLKFHTKRLTSKLFGYISKTDSSIGTDLHMDYKFINTKEQRVSLKFSVANRSRKNLAVILGTCDIQSTAYPNYNFFSNVTFQKSGSHLEFNVDLIQNPLPLNDTNSDFESLKFDFKFSHKAFTDNKQTIKAISTVKRKSSNLDMKGIFFYETANFDVNMECAVNYGDNKQAAVTIFWSHPRTTMEEIKAHLNITVPTFTPMILKVEISEMQNRDYRLDISGTWFSGHSAHAVGIYQDSSTALASNHHLKVFIKSPSFKDVNADLLFYRDNEQLKIDVEAIHEENDYQLFINHNSTSDEEMHTNVKIKCGTRLYTLNTAINRGEHFKISTELHIDQLRDVEFSVWIFNEETQKALGFDINWDANRDPSQKLLVAANLSTAGDLNYNADLIVSYPGRTIIGNYEFLFEKGHIDMLASISWDDGKSLAINFNAKYRYENEIFFGMSFGLNTPVDSWKNIKLSGVFEHIGNKYGLNGALTWNPRQKVAIDLYGDYTSKGPNFDCKYSCSVESTLSNIPYVNTTVQHSQNSTDYNTIVFFMYNPDFLIDVESMWKLQTNEIFSNLTGTVKTVTPFKGFKKGVFVSKIFYTANKYLRGAAEIDLDHNKILIDMEGKFKKLIDSMFVANITTPDETYECKFKLSKKDRHFIALLSYPTGQLGTEVLVVLNDLTDFNVKLLLATPVEFLQKILIIAKLQPKEADFRIGWNSLLLGFSGRWYYSNIIDFLYTYRIYTPIKDFEDNGIVAKLIFKEGLDFEMSCKLSLFKLGVKLIGKPKPKLLKELGVNIRDVYYSRPVLRESDKDGDFLSLEGLIEVDAIVFPTMKGLVEIDQKGAVYVLQSKIHLPHGIATIIDEFEYVDVLSMSNTLRIVTPYKRFKTLKSDFNLQFIQNQRYMFHLNLRYENNSVPIIAGVLAEYNVHRQNIDERIYNVTLDLDTPFKAFPKLKLFGAFETEENFYRTKLLFTTNSSDISLDATTETDDGWMGLTSDFHVKSPIINVPECQIRLTKLSSYSNNYVEIHLKVPDKLKSEVYFRTSWLFKALNQFRSTLELETPFTGLESTKVGLDFLSRNERTTLWAYFHVHPIASEFNSTFENDLLTSAALIKFGDKIFPVNINCKILASSQNRRELNGTLLLRDKVFKINGNANLIRSLPVKVLITFTPQDNSTPLTFQYNLETTLKGYGLVGALSYANRLTRFSGNATVDDTFNWEVNLKVDPPDSMLKVAARVIAKSIRNGASLDTEITTNMPNNELSKFGINYRREDTILKSNGYFLIGYVEGRANVDLTYVYLEDMCLRGIGNYKNQQFNSSSQVELFYRNPEQAFKELTTGGDLKIDDLWEAGTNASLMLPSKNNLSFEGYLKIPNDYRETHSLFGKLIYGTGLSFIDYLVKYRSTYPTRKYGLWGEVLLETKKNISGTAIVEYDGQEYYNNVNLLRQEKAFDFLYKLKVPEFPSKDFFVGQVMYNALNEHHNITCKMFHPEDVLLAFGTIDYVELANMFGIFNISVPYKSLNFSGAHFKSETTSNFHNRYVKFFWANNSAVLDSKCDIQTGNTPSKKNYKGELHVELPLATRHIGDVHYEYDKKSEISTGWATVHYNGGNVLEGKYNCLTKSQADEEIDTIHVELLNKMVPIGADYVHKHPTRTQKDGYNVLTLDSKHLQLYHLQNRSKFDLTGEINVETHQDGQAYILTATHLNRTVILSADYSIQDQEYKQHSRLELSPSTWIEYDFSLINKTTDDIFDVEIFVINMSYPRRNFSIQAFYNISDSLVSTDISLVWDKDNKSVEAALDWRKIALHREQMILLLKHPSFQKDVSLVSTYGYANSTLDGKVVIDYATIPEQTVTFGIRAQNKSRVQAYNYTYNIWAEHNATNLYLNCLGHIHWSPRKCGTEHIVDYKRSYLSLSRSFALVKVDSDLNDILLKKEDIIGKSHFWGRYDGRFPLYTANMTSAHGNDHTSGKLYVNFDEKLLSVNVNLTEDGSQSLHTYGVIPDARSVTFEIWRDYEDKRLSDVSYYLKLNHSRLIMSELKWRPELINDVQNGIRSKAMQLYNDALDQVNNTRQYVRVESMEALDGIWQDAKPIMSKFLIDLRNLTVIEEDLGYLKIFLNESYHNNDFHIKSICTVIMTLFDDLSLKSHLQSLPKIFQELWTVMGASGKNIKESINFVIEKLKLYYANTTQFIHDLINGDPIKHLSSILEKLVDTYDDYIKNMHVSALKYLEKIWSGTHDMLVDNWHQILAALEPTFLKFIHYGETIIWTTGKEFLDFLYTRKNKIIESAYFMEFTKFSRDVDRFYRDITGNNTVEAIYKYGNIAWNFVNEKYINHIPFGKELKAILLEIIAELKQLGDVPSITYALDIFNDMFAAAKYYYKYFEVEYRAHRLIKFLYRKFSEMALTALELDNRQREAKTKFIYEPNDGIMILEEKLPMSWHGFNETPQFQEIPEIKVFYDLYNYLETSEASFWNFYHNYISYTDPSEWLPPFKGHAMLIGGNNFITFDKRYYNFRGSCTYLLATDFVNRNFTLLVSYNEKGLFNELVLLINRTVVSINIFENTVTVDDSITALLPLEIGNNHLYREADIIILASNSGYTLECNVKFQICIFEVSGWHYGRTAGLWGSYNNEPYDDLTFPNRSRPNIDDLTGYADSWAVSPGCKTKAYENTKEDKPDSMDIESLCYEFFHNKVSDLSTCFPTIPKDDFLKMCMNSKTTLEACRSAIAYIEICHRQNTPLNIPDSCIMCSLSNGTELNEGDFIRLYGNTVPKTADVVFIVEAKKCNKDLKNHKNFNTVVESINQELLELNITNNRYAVVAFGGNGVFNAPRSIVINSKTFTDSKSVLKYFDIPVGNGEPDIYRAISFASKLMFRPEASRNFILLPCSGCYEQNLQYDYATVHQLLFENAASLHILINNSFNVLPAELRKRDNKIPYGIDLTKAYTKKDIKKLDGDQALRNSISFTKSTLGLCLSLALETNGTIFSSKHLELQKNAKKFSTVLAKRVAYSAVPRDCTDCECTSLHNGLSYMECTPCTYPRINMEHHRSTTKVEFY
ncbi:unnamed protein product [Ceutorhynchus assimilis]|uniref:Vitellogenin domain-containing protein n=1 Tax=Ceutorhynchus assimilis TaxID=467358 RepID=A0A9N9QDS2_9CUCU|nr:unnamed protein product [Ceutorhynchus assimilis]